MPRPTLRILAYLGLAFGLHVTHAPAGVGVMRGLPRSTLGHLSRLQTAQAGECWEQDGPDGPGYYPCGDGGGGLIIGPAIRRTDRHGVGGVSPSPGAAPVSHGLAGVHEGNGAAGARVGAPVSPAPAGGGVTTPHIAVPAAPGPAASAVAPHIAAPASPGPAGGAVGAPHIGAPASPGLAGVHGAGGGGGALPSGGIGHR
jgi:hypothetical protein